MSRTPDRRRTSGRLRRGVAGVVALAAALSGASLAAAPAGAVEGDLTTDLVGWWKLDETTGTVAADSSGNGRDGTVAGAASWNAGDGFTFAGGASSSGNAIKLPDDLLAGVDNVTVDFDVWVDPSLSGNNFIFNLGNTATWPNGNGYLFVTDRDAGSRLRATIAEAGGGNGGEQSISRAGGLTRGAWKHLTYSITGGTVDSPGSAQLYEDGVLVASSTTITTKPSLMGTPDGTTTHNFLGRSAYAGDQSFKGRLRDVRIYSRALTGDEAAERALATNTAAVEADHAALDLGDTSAVTADLALPLTGPSGSAISWASSDPGVVAEDGAVTRPAYGEPDATATLTATLTRGTVSRTKEFVVTVLADDVDDDAKVQAALAALELVHADDVRGNLTLPGSGASGTAFTWSSGAPAVVSATGEVTRPTHGEEPVDVVLTVTGTLNAATADRSIVVRVRPMPAELDYEAYAFTYFAGESTPDGEKIYFAGSQGNDPLAYDELNDGLPLLTSELGEKGLRDPFLIRSPEGDRFFLIATDLKIHGGNNFGEAQESGSKSLMIWESTDLVNWSGQREVKVSSDFAGNTWAPEAFYDEASGQYVVYWASNLYDTTDTSTRSYTESYNRMMYATTRDFVTFSEPTEWIDVKRGTGRGMIDVTVVQDGDTFHRVVKDEATMTPRQERSTDLLATVEDTLPTTTSEPGWQLVKERVGVGQPNPWGGTFTNGEGPTIFADNEVDDQWYMFIDQPSYHGGQGYLAFRSDDIGSGDWTSVPDADLPTSPRHGTVIPVTQAELDGMRAAWQPDLLVSSLDEAAVSTGPGVAPELPTGVSATFGDGSTGEVEVEWDDIPAEEYAQAGSFLVEGTVVRGAADRARAQVTVTDGDAPTLTLGTVPADPDGKAGWWVSDPVRVVAAAEDAAGVREVETSLDDGAWQSTAGDRAEVEVTGDGEHDVRARAHDTTGNTADAVSVDVRVDATPPISRASLDDRTVTVRAADATSGVARVEYRLDDGEWTAYDGAITVGDEPATVAYRSRDVAGNVETVNTLAVPAAGTEPVATTTVAVSSLATAHVGQQVVVRARVLGAGDVRPSGTVRLVSGDRLLGTATLGAGGAVFRLDTAELGRVGLHTVSVEYDGDATHLGSTDTVALRLMKAGSRSRVRLPRRVPAGARAVARIRVTSPHGHPLPDRVRVIVKKKAAGKGARKVRRDVALTASGRARLRLPKLSRGTWKVVVRTVGSSTLVGSRDRTRLVVTPR